MYDSKTGTFWLAVGLLLALGIGCQSFRSSGHIDSPKNDTPAGGNSPAPDPPKRSIVSADDKTDYTFTAEDFFKEYKNEKNGIKGQKYVEKIIEVTGRFLDFDLTKKDPSGGYAARLTAGGMFEWVRCSVDEDNTDEFTKIAKDQKVTFKGLGAEFWAAGPALKHCIVMSNH